MVAIGSKPLSGAGLSRDQRLIEIDAWRKKTTAAVNERKLRHHDILDQMDEGHLLLTAEGLIAHANPAALRILGQSRDGLVGEYLANLFAVPANLEPAALKLTEIDYTSPAGVKLCLELSCFPVRVVPDEIAWLDVSVHDVTIRRDRYEQLRVQSIVLDQLDEIISVLAPNNRLLYCNMKMAKFWGYSREEALSRTPEEIWGADFIRTLRGKMQRAFDAGSEHFSTEYAFPHWNGQEVILDLSINLLHDTDGNVIGRVSVARDITERRKMADALAEREAEFAQILENIPAAITRYDRFGRLTYANAEALNILERPSAAVIGLKLSEINPLFQSYEDILMNVIAAGADYQQNFVPRQEKGLPRFTNFKYVPIFSSAGVASGALLMSVDVTAEWQARNELLQAKLDAETANRSKSEFLANMSHELRTPLNAIIGFSDLLSSHLYGPLNDKQDSYCKDIYNSGTHLLSIISEILDLSKIEAGRFELEERNVDVAAAIESCISIVDFKAQEKQITIEKRVPPGLPRLLADELCIKQIALNLLSNAVKFTRQNGCIQIDAGIDPAGDLVIRIADNGVGINAQDMPKLFEPFQQAESGRSRQFGGTGLGLSICKRMMDLHQGGISLTSEEWVGTTATLRFPASRIRPA